MSTGQPDRVRYQILELGGQSYAVIRESQLLELCRRAGVEPDRSASPGGISTVELAEMNLDREALARRLRLRRRQAGLTQVELARRAGIRVETLNRVERGHTTPDFSTIRKLVIAINSAGAELDVVQVAGSTNRKEQ